MSDNAKQQPAEDSNPLKHLESRGYSGFERLDTGGQGSVYKTAKEGKFFAIKVVSIAARKGPQLSKLDDDLSRELIIGRQLRHPNCVRYEDLFRTPTKMYIVMDYLPRGTLAKRIKDRGAVCEWQAKLWFADMAFAMKYLHEHQIAHRDLKLDNILLDENYNAVVADYGYSRFLPYLDDEKHPDSALSRTYCGTPSHYPPEINRKIRYNPYKGDVWCMGIMLFIMINKDYPFDKKLGKEGMAAKQAAKDYHLRPEIEAKMSLHVKHLIGWLLEPVPDQRPTIKQVVKHPWLPSVLHENEFQQELSKSIRPTNT